MFLEHDAKLVPIHRLCFRPVAWSAFLSYHLVLGLEFTSSNVPDHTRQSGIPLASWPPDPLPLSPTLGPCKGFGHLFLECLFHQNMNSLRTGTSSVVVSAIFLTYVSLGKTKKFF